MSSTDHPETGSNPNESPAVTSPQEPQPNQTEPESTTAHTTETSTEPKSPVAEESTQDADAAIAKNPAGGETVAPVPATSTTTATDAAIAQPQVTESPAMNTEEPKQPAEVSSEQSEDVEGKEMEDSGPSLDITLLLTTGSRHPFTIDGKYLRKRSVNVENYDPFAMSVYTLKELIWREWRSDWEARPSSPSSIRLISFGKLLEDKSPLSESKFNHDAPNVVHMTVKPQEVVDEEDAKGTKTLSGRERENNERSPGCRCVIL